MRISCRAVNTSQRVKSLSMQWAFALALLLCSPLSFALSLGEVRIESNLNEPLQGSITVNSASASELGSLRVGLAGRQDWQRAGLSPSSAVSRIKFGFKSTGGGRLAITLRTEEPVSEPLLVILVDATWSSGHLLREYTVFLDPANLPKQNTAPVAPPQISKPVNSPVNNSPASNSPRNQHSSTTRNANPFLVSNAVSSGRYGPVRRGESLSTISEGIFIGTDLSMHQVVWALYTANPHAFVNGNINLLETGVNLKVPSQEEMLALPTPQARELVFQAARLQRPPPGVFAESDGAAESAPVAQASAAAKPERNQSSQAGKSETESNNAAANESNQDAAAAESSTANNGAPQASEAVQPVANDKLELLPLEAVDEVASSANEVAGGQSDSQPNTSTDGDSGSAAAPSAVGGDGQASSRERQLTNENVLLRQRIDETEALLKEIRTLLAARSEQLSDLQQRLDRVEKGNANQQLINQSEQNSADIGWFWWLLLAVALIIAGLLVALLFVLAKRSDRGAMPSALLHDDVDDETESDDMFGGVAASASAAPAALKDKEEVDDEVEAFIESNLIMPKVHNPESRDNDLSSAALAPVIAEGDAQDEALDEPLMEEPVATAAPAAVEPEVDALADVDSGVERRLPADDSALDFNLDDYVEGPAKESVESGEQAAPSISEAPGSVDFDAELADFDVELIDPIADPIAESVPDLNPDLDSEPVSLEPNQETDIPPILNESELENLEIESQLAEPGVGLDEVDPSEMEPAVLEEAAVDAVPDADVSGNVSGNVSGGASTDVSEFSGGDQVATKLDLARVYVDMGDADEARSILNEILEQGSEAQQQEAQSLLDSMA